MLLLTRNRRRWIAVAGVTLVAFAHAAIAVSGCLTSAMPASEAGCEEHQQTSPSELLCRTHLQAEAQTLDVAKLPQVLHFDAPVLTFAPAQGPVPADCQRAISVRSPVAGAPPPPLNLIYSRSLT
jgi:hypothetical protein